MQIPIADWIVIFAHPVLSLGFGFYYDRGASGGIGNIFVNGGHLPWTAGARLNNVSNESGASSKTQSHFR